MSVYLVTGAAGFIGSEFVRQVIAETSHRIIALDALTYAGNRANLASVVGDARLQFVHGDIRDRQLIDHLLEQHQCNVVANFAAETHVDRSIVKPDSFVGSNVLGTFELLEASRRYWQSLDATGQREFRFLQVSTDEVFGTLAAKGSFSESSPYLPNSPYSASKAASDHLVRAFRQTYGLPTLTAVCANNYGPFQFPEKLVPLMIRKVTSGEMLPVYGAGDQVRDWLFVGDCCRALRAIVERGQVGEVYNVGGGAEFRNIDEAHLPVSRLAVSRSDPTSVGTTYHACG
jgi:dTDP-glucose 4,6-dehydratase